MGTESDVLFKYSEHHAIYNFLDKNQTPIILYDTMSQDKEKSSFTAYDIDLSLADIETLTAGELINENIATVLLRLVYLALTYSKYARVSM